MDPESGTASLADRGITPPVIPDASDKPVATGVPLSVAVEKTAASDPATPDPPEAGGHTEKAESISRGEQLAKKLIDNRTNRLIKQMSDGAITYTAMSPGDRALWSIYSFQGALPEGVGTTIDKNTDGAIDGVPIHIDGNDYIVLTVSNGRSVDGKRVYSGQARDATGAEVPLPKISGDALADAYMTKHADEIASLFPEGPQRDLVAWRARAEEGKPPIDETQLQAVEDNIKKQKELDANPFLHADQAIAQQITLLTESLSGESLPDEQKAEINKLLTELKLAEVTNGDLGKLLKINALARAQEAAGPLVGKEIQGILEELEPHRQTAEENLSQMLKNSGAPEAKIEAWREAANKPDGLYQILSDPDFQNLPDMSIAVFGKELTGADAANADLLIKDFAETHITEEQRKLLEFSKKTGKNALWILAILLAIPAAVAAGAVYVGANSGGGRR